MHLKPVASNMTEIENGDVTILFSYSTPVACHIAGDGFYRTSKKHSVTTSSHLTKWLKHHGGTAYKAERPQEYFDGLCG